MWLGFIIYFAIIKRNVYQVNKVMSNETLIDRNRKNGDKTVLSTLPNI